MQKEDIMKILIVDDHAVVRTGLRMILESQSDMDIVGEASNRTETLAFADSKNFVDIVLLDVDMDSDNGVDLLPELRDAFPDARFIILTGVRDVAVHTRALQLGASGLVRKEKAAEDLTKAIRRVHLGELWFDRNIMGNALSKLRHSANLKDSDPEIAKIGTLTERERQVIVLIGQGLKNKDIATRLFISETTVRHHLTSIFDKLGVSDRLELLIYAFRYRLAKLPY